MPAFAGLNLYDHMKATPSSCQEYIVKNKIPRSLFVIDEIKNNLKPLRETKLGHHFYHYTDSAEMSGFFYILEKDRRAAQELIHRDGSFDKIMKHSSQDIKNLAGPGFYIAANPKSSMEYGKTQIHFAIDPEAKVFTDLRPDFQSYAPTLNRAKDILTKRVTGTNYYVPCTGQQLIGIAIQESGADLVYYDKQNEWVALYNTDVIESTDIIDGVSKSTNLIRLFAKENRLDEIDPNKGNGLALPDFWVTTEEFDRITQWLLKAQSIDRLGWFIQSFDPDSKDENFPEKNLEIPDLITGNTELRNGFADSFCYKGNKDFSYIQKLIRSKNIDKERKKALKIFEKQNCKKA